MQEVIRALKVYEDQMSKKEAELAKRKELLNAETRNWEAEKKKSEADHNV